jgi:Fe-S cluster assembly protein SufD
VAVELPLHSLLWSDAEGLGLFPHTLIVAGEASQVAVVEEHSSLPGDRYVGHTVEIIASPASVVTYVYVQDLGVGAWNLSYQKSLTHRDSSLDLVAVAAGGRLCKANIYGSMVGPGATARLSGFFFGDDAQVFDFHTLQDHVAPRTTSDLLYKGVLKDESRATYAGLIRVERAAQGTDAYQANRNLLLNPGARADSIPTLEIQANDVRCTHGATVSRIDEEQLYYLLTRGLPRKAAEYLIVQGFFEPIVERIPLDTVRARVNAIIDRKMEAF